MRKGIRRASRRRSMAGGRVAPLSVGRRMEKAESREAAVGGGLVREAVV
jgi:hypothetical protein